MAMSSNHRSFTNQRQRRGVVLLVVLSLLVLFVIVGLTFTLVASVYRKSATATARSADREDDRLDELDRAMYLILRGADHATPLAHQPILEDIYGGGTTANSVTGPLQTTIFSVAAQMGGELYQIELDRSASGIVSNKFGGCVLTVISGLAKNRSYRVVASGASGGNRIMLLATPANRFGAFVRQRATDGAMNSYQPIRNDRVLLTRRPFSGLGAGFSFANGNMTHVGNTTILNSLEQWLALKASLAPAAGPYTGNNSDVNELRGIPAYLALMPNYSAYVAGRPDGTNAGMNEDWDAPDFQNMFLAYMPPVATAADEIIPSFHRPALVR